VEFWLDLQKQRKCEECGNPISFHKMDCSRPKPRARWRE
jgi:hypothetical protein